MRKKKPCARSRHHHNSAGTPQIPHQATIQPEPNVAPSQEQRKSLTAPCRNITKINWASKQASFICISLRGSGSEASPTVQTAQCCYSAGFTKPNLSVAVVVVHAALCSILPSNDPRREKVHVARTRTVHLLPPEIFLEPGPYNLRGEGPNNNNSDEVLMIGKRTLST